VSANAVLSVGNLWGGPGDGLVGFLWGSWEGLAGWAGRAVSGWRQPQAGTRGSGYALNRGKDRWVWIPVDEHRMLAYGTPVTYEADQRS
jgi:hypothetical protein